MEQQDIARLVKKAKKGDKKATSALYERTHNSVYFLVIRMIGGNEQDAQDTVQNAYIKAFSSLDTLKDDGKFIPWLNQIAINESKQYLRRQSGKNILFVGDFDTESIEELSEDFIPQAYIESATSRQLILKIIDGLPINQKLCVMYYYYHDMKISEIAEEMGCSESTVKSNLNYAKAKIRKGVEALEKDGTKLYGAGAMPILSQLFKSASEDSAIPKAVSEQILTNTLSSVAVTGSMAAMGVVGIMGKFAALSVGAKTAVVAVIAVAVAGGVAVPIYANAEKQKAVMAMAVIEQEEAERAASEAAEVERIAREAEASRVAEEKAAAEKAEAERVEAARIEEERVRLEAEAEAARIAEEEAEAARLEAERLAAEQAEAERIAAEQAAIAAQQTQQAAQAQAPAGSGGQVASPNPPNGQKEVNTNDLEVGTILPGGIRIVDGDGFTPR